MVANNNKQASMKNQKAIGDVSEQKSLLTFNDI